MVIGEPALVVLRDPFSESGIGLGALVIDERTHGAVLQLYVPTAERTLDRLPFLDGGGGVDHVGDVAPFLTVVLLYLLGHDRLLVDMFLEAQQDLTRVDGFDEVIGYLLADRLLHDMLLFGLGDHHHRHFRMQTFDLLQGLQSRHARHVLVQKDDVNW